MRTDSVVVGWRAACKRHLPLTFSVVARLSQMQAGGRRMVLGLVPVQGVLLPHKLARASACNTARLKQMRTKLNHRKIPCDFGLAIRQGQIVCNTQIAE